MCCFSRTVAHVSSTTIFARPLDGDRQLLVYGMTVELAEDVAMILPIPIPPNAPADAVRFVDLSACPDFFAQLERLFPQPASASFSEGPSLRGLAPQSMLVVHDVGDFEASFVPTPRDFDRLDARFRLPHDVWEQLPAYRDWGFCVFKLKTRQRPSGFLGLFKGKPLAETRAVHPMAFEFPRRDPSGLFFPTVHVHDGAVHPTAEFDHALYCQTTRELEPLMDWVRSAAKGEQLMGAREHTAPDQWLYKKTLRGEHPNRDTVLAESKLRARTALDALFRLRMCATCEHLVDDGRTSLDDTTKRWMRVSEAERTRIRDSMLAELGPLFAVHRAAWGVRPFVHDAPDLVVFAASNERIEPQELHVAFDRPPPARVRDEVQAAVQRALDHASG